MASIRRRARSTRAPLLAALLVGAICAAACSRQDQRPQAPWSPPATWASPLAERPLRRDLPGLADLLQARGSTELQLRDRLAARANNDPAPFAPYNFSVDVDYARRAAQLETAGWSANAVAPLPLHGPVAWGTAVADDPNWHYQLNAFRPWEAHVLTAHSDPRGQQLDTALAAARDWIAFNLLQDGDNTKKWYDMGAGLRAHAFAVLLHALLRRDDPELDLVRLLVWALREHGVVLTDPRLLPEGNHALFMMLGVKAICAAVPELPECSAWQRYADQGVDGYLAATVSREGVSLEHSPGYHWFVAGTLRGFVRTGLFTPDLTRAGDDMLATAVWMLHPSGALVNVGDSDGAGKAGVHAFVDFALDDGRSGRAPADAPQAFPQAGVAVLRDPWTRSPINGHDYLYLSAAQHSTVHKHADDGTFEWSCGGREVIVDSGKFSYRRGNERTFFVSTRAANTIEIDGSDLPVHDREPYGSGLGEVGRTPGGVQHAACRVPREHGVVHHRLVVMGRGWMLVADELRADHPHTYRQWLGFHEDFALQPGDGQRLELTAARGAAITVTQLAGGDFETIRGATDPLQGWISRRYQERVPRWSVATTRVGDDVRIATLLASPGVTLTAASDEADGLHVAIDDADGSHHLLLRVTAGTDTVRELPARPR